MVATMTEQSPANTTVQPVLRLHEIHKSFGRHHVLKGISLDFPEGKSTVVLGPSGCGKSVMLKHLVGLLKPDSGEVWYRSHRVDQLSERRLVPIRRDIGFLFQQAALFDSMDVCENVAFPLQEHTDMNRQQREQQVRRVLAMVGMAEALHKMPGDLSGGQRKRVALARAIVLRPKVVLYDEPTTGLDPIRSDVINSLIIKLQKDLKITSIVVTHDLVSAFKIADHLVMLDGGHVVAHGAPGHFRASEDQRVQRFLRGEAGPEELAGMSEESTSKKTERATR